MRDLSQRIEQLTHELRELRLQLQWTNSQPSLVEHNPVLNHVLDATLVSDLTEVANQLTHFLWRYIESASQPADGVDFALQGKRLEQATHMLRRLRSVSSPAQDEDPAAFVSRVTRVVDRLLEASGQPEPGTNDRILHLERSA